MGEDDLLSLASDTGIGGELEAQRNDFQLTPLEEADEGEDSESGSQVIALDTEGEGDDAATMIGGGAAAMLDEDLSTEPFGVGGMPMTAPGMASAAAMTGQTGDMTLGGQPAVYLPEAPYTIWNIVGLVLCTLVLILVGMMMYDLLQNMWTWDAGPSAQQPDHGHDPGLVREVRPRPAVTCDAGVPPASRAAETAALQDRAAETAAPQYA